MNTADYVYLIRGAMSEKRFTHSMNVADMCVKLACRHGYAATERAYIAGVLHDVRKEAPSDTVYEEMLAFGNADDAEIEAKPLWHAVAGGYYVRHELGLDDEIADAVRFHTVGHADMSLLEKIVYIGDLVSVERHFENVEMYRNLAFENLEKAVLESVKFTMRKVMELNGAIPHCSFDAYNFYRR